MRKTKRLIIIAIIALFTVFSLAACSSGGSSSGAQSSPNAQSYEELSEAMKMFNEAVAAGYEGDYLDFLAEFLGGSNGSEETPSESEQESGSSVRTAVASVVSIKSSFEVKYGGARFKTSQAGAGVIYKLDTTTWDAYIITNYHVIYESGSAGNETIPHVSDDISVYLYGGEVASCELSATFVGGAIDYDVAVLYIKGSDTVLEQGGVHSNAEILQNSAARAIEIADSDLVTVGDEVFAIGNPAADGISVTRGVISVEAEYIEMTALNSNTRKVKFLEMRIDAAVNHGNSGGGLFNAAGEFIGTVNARSEEDGVYGFGYAIPANLVIAVADNAIDAFSGGISRVSLGITVQVTTSHSVYNEELGNVRIIETVGVAAVDDGAAADILHVGDVILSAELHGVKKEITREYMLSVMLMTARVGDTLTLEIARGGEVLSVDITLAAKDFSAVS